MLKMLNLTIGKKYKVTSFDYPKERIFEILNKTIHYETCHSYFVKCVQNNKEYVYYLWDYGYANSDRKIVFASHAIKTCEEVVEELYYFDYEVCDLKDSSASLYKNLKLAIHTTINGKGKVGRLSKE